MFVFEEKNRKIKQNIIQEYKTVLFMFGSWHILITDPKSVVESVLWYREAKRDTVKGEMHYEADTRNSGPECTGRHHTALLPRGGRHGLPQFKSQLSLSHSCDLCQSLRISHNSASSSGQAQLLLTAGAHRVTLVIWGSHNSICTQKSSPYLHFAFHGLNCPSQLWSKNTEWKIPEINNS